MFPVLSCQLLSPLPKFGREAGNWRPQPSWPLEFPVVGKENAGGGDCSGHERRSRKLEVKENEFGKFPCSLLYRVASKGENSE